MITLEGFRELVKERFENSEKYHNAMNEHFKTLNGQVGKNTAFRQKGNVYIGIIGIIAAAVIGLVVDVLFI